MKGRGPLELMESAWAARRASFDLSDAERRAAVEAVRTDLDRAATMLRGRDEGVLYAHALHLRAHVELDVGDVDRAAELWSEAVAVLRVTGDPLQLAHKVRHLGDLERERGRLGEAEAHYAEALGLYRAHGGALDLDFANAVNRMALVKEAMGDTAEARELWREVRERYGGLGLQEGVGEAERHLADLG